MGWKRPRPWGTRVVQGGGAENLNPTPSFSHLHHPVSTSGRVSSIRNPPGERNTWKGHEKEKLKMQAFLGSRESQKGTPEQKNLPCPAPIRKIDSGHSLPLASSAECSNSRKKESDGQAWVSCQPCGYLGLGRCHDQKCHHNGGSRARGGMVASGRGKGGCWESDSLSCLLPFLWEAAQTLPSQGLLLWGLCLCSSSLLAFCPEYSVTMDSPMLTAAFSGRCVLLSHPDPCHLGACAVSLSMAATMPGTEKKAVKCCWVPSREFERAHCHGDPASFSWPTALQPNSSSSCFSNTRPALLFPSHVACFADLSGPQWGRFYTPGRHLGTSEDSF